MKTFTQITLTLIAVVVSIPFTSKVFADEPAAPATPPADVTIMTGTYQRNYQTGEYTDIKVTGKARIGVKKVQLAPGEGDEKGMRAFLTTDDFTEAEEKTFIVQVKDKLMVPVAYGGSKDKLWSLDLYNVDEQSAAILAGRPLDPAPEDSFKIEFLPLFKGKVGGKVQVQLSVTNTSATPWTIYYATDGGGNYPCRDLRFTFSAMRDGQPVSPNPKLLPNGFVSSPFALKPNSALKRTLSLDEWLQFDQPGTYQIDATYNLTVTNPKTNAMPTEWDISYPAHFTIEVVK